jgi:hypothetical protein
MTTPHPATPDLEPFTQPVGPRANNNADPDHPVHDLWEALAPHHGPERATELIAAYYRAVATGPTPEEALTVTVELPYSAVRAIAAAVPKSLQPCASTTRATAGNDEWTTHGPCDLPAGHTGYCTHDGWRWMR